MRSRASLIGMLVVLLSLAGTAVMRARGSGNICGIIARFTLLDQATTPSGKLRVRLILENRSDTTSDFRYFGGAFLQHVRVFTKTEKPAPIRTDAPFLEAAADRITLKAGEKFETEFVLILSQRYDLSPGKYYLQFYYDVRLIPDEQCAAEHRKHHGGKNWGLWDGKRYPFSVSRLPDLEN